MENGGVKERSKTNTKSYHRKKSAETREHWKALDCTIASIICPNEHKSYLQGMALEFTGRKLKKLVDIGDGTAIQILCQRVPRHVPEPAAVYSLLYRINQLGGEESVGKRIVALAEEAEKRVMSVGEARTEVARAKANGDVNEMDKAFAAEYATVFEARGWLMQAESALEMHIAEMSEIEQAEQYARKPLRR